MFKTQKFNISGMTCASCQANITKSVKKLNGISDVNVSLLSNQMTVNYNDDILTSNEIINAVNKIGYGAELIQQNKSKTGDLRSKWQERKNHVKKQQSEMKFRMISSIILTIPLMYISMGHMLHLPTPDIFNGTQNILISAITQFILTIPIIIINSHFYISGSKALIKRSPNMDSLVFIGSFASLIYGIFALYRMAYGLGHNDINLVSHYSHELYFESAAMILTFVTIGKYLESKSKFKTSDALEKLVNLTPKTALVVRNNEEKIIPSEDILVNDIIIIKPGESIPVDGKIIDGYGYIDQSAITGESIPVEKNTGDDVISATINKNGYFKMRASKVGDDTTLSQIIKLIDETANSKAPISRIADKISGIFVPIVILISVITLITWLFSGYPFEFALSCSITVLVISCPCALGLATPVAIMAGTGKAASYGILIKSAQSLESLHSIDTIVLDKTGTITSGKPEVTDILTFNNNISENDFLKIASAIENGSEHPLALAIIQKAKSTIDFIPKVDSFKNHSGKGISANINKNYYVAGNLAFITENNIDIPENVIKQITKLSNEGKTPMLFAENKSIIGVIAVADTIKSSSEIAIKQLIKLGLHIIMLTGDNKITAEAIRKKLNIEKVIADVLPSQKQACIKELQNNNHKVAMVGDGINDAPALTQADIGIAIANGTDIAIDSADIVLMKSSLVDVVTSIALSKAVIKNIHMNLFWAFFYNILGIPLAAGILYPAFGLRLSPMIGALAMSLSSIFVVLNALRLRFFKYNFSLNTDNDNSNLLEYKEYDKMKKFIKIDGMQCDHCKNNVKNALENLEQVQTVSIDLQNKTATVSLSDNISDQLLKDAIANAGYNVISIK